MKETISRSRRTRAKALRQDCVWCFPGTARGQCNWSAVYKQTVVENGLERSKEQGNVEACMLWKELEFCYE